MGDLRRSHVVTIRLRPDEHDILATAAAAARLKPAALARGAVLAASIGELAPADLPAPVQPVDTGALVRKELRKARADLRYLVERFKAGNRPAPSEIQRALAELTRTISAALGVAR